MGTRRKNQSVKRGENMKFTKRLLEAIEPSDKRQYFYDDEFTGLALRVGTSGRKTFYLGYRTGKGRATEKKWVMLGAFPAMTVEQARDLAKEKAGHIVNGRDPALEVREEKDAISIAAALDSFLEEYVAKLKPSTIAFYQIVVEKHLRPGLGKLRANKLGYTDVARFHTTRKATPYMANRCIAVLSVFLNWCELHGYRDKNTNPCKEIKLNREHMRQEFMGTAELTILGDTLSRMERKGQVTTQTAAAIRLLMFTGARRGEILSLKWNYIDLEQGVARLPDSKTGFKVLQLSSPAVAVLESLPQFTEYVLPSNSASGHMVDIKKPWGNLLKHSGLSGWRIHDLRHAFASMMVNSGASLPIVGKILGHTQARTTQRYAHLEENPARKAAEEAAAKIAAALQATPKPTKQGIIIPLRKVGNDK